MVACIWVKPQATTNAWSRHVEAGRTVVLKFQTSLQSKLVYYHLITVARFPCTHHVVPGRWMSHDRTHRERTQTRTGPILRRTHPYVSHAHTPSKAHDSRRIVEYVFWQLVYRIWQIIKNVFVKKYLAKNMPRMLILGTIVMLLLL